MGSSTKSFIVRHATFDDIPSLTTIVPRSFHPTNPYILKVSHQLTSSPSPTQHKITIIHPLLPVPPQHPRHPPMVDRSLHLQAQIPNEIPPPHNSLPRQPITLPRRSIPSTPRRLRSWRRFLECVPRDVRPRRGFTRGRRAKPDRRPRNLDDGPAAFRRGVVRG